jgi:hypothetical protein
MNRLVAFAGAVLAASVSLASACSAAQGEPIRFTLGPDRERQSIQASFRSNNGRGRENDWSTDFRPSDLAGLDVAAFRGGGTRPLRFALVREAGRLDCSGTGGGSHASGNCGFTADPGFMQFLQSRGVARPTNDQAIGLMALNVRRDLIDAIAAAHYPAPTIDNLMSLSALGIDGRYVARMAGAGYRPRTLDALVQFKALDITPQWIAGFVGIGYGDLPADQLMQLKALGITPDYIAGFDRVGYRHLPVDRLVQLKALDITPEFVRSVAGPGGQMPDVATLMRWKTVGRRR